MHELAHTQPQQLPSRPSARAIWSVLAVALVARLLVLAQLRAHQGFTWIFSRGLETGFVAHALLSHQGFASPFGEATGPTALISPGYVLLVAAVFRIFGEYTVTSALVILLCQILLGVLTVWLVMQLTSMLTQARVALLAGCFVAVWPTFLWVPTIFWDTAFTLCLMPGLLLLAWRLHTQTSRGAWLAFGALSGCSVLINMALVPVVVAVFVWAVYASAGLRRDKLLAALLALTLYAPWPVRNAHALHAFIPLRTTVGLELWMGNREGATGFLDESVFPLYNRAELDSYQKLGEVAYMHAKSVQAMSFIKQQPRMFVWLTAKRILRFWSGTGTRQGSRFYEFSSLLTTVLGFCGVVNLFRQRKRALATLCSLPLLLFPLPYYITHAEFRYRLALEPLLIALAAAFLARWVDQAPEENTGTGESTYA